MSLRSCASPSRHSVCFAVHSFSIKAFAAFRSSALSARRPALEAFFSSAKRGPDRRPQCSPTLCECATSTPITMRIHERLRLRGGALIVSKPLVRAGSMAKWRPSVIMPSIGHDRRRNLHFFIFREAPSAISASSSISRACRCFSPMRAISSSGTSSAPRSSGRTGVVDRTTAPCSRLEKMPESSMYNDRTA